LRFEGHLWQTVPDAWAGDRKTPYLAELQKTYENLTTNLGKSYEVSKIGPQKSKT